MIIRRETRDDVKIIHDITAAAFAGKSYSDGTEPGIIDALRKAGALSVSLVADENGMVLGHVALSPVRVSNCENWYGLGPIAVTPKRQKQGIGSALIAAAFAELEHLGAHGCALTGDPNYYARFGFVSTGALSYNDTPVKYIQHVTLRGAEPAGELAFHDAFGGA